MTTVVVSSNLLRAQKYAHTHGLGKRNSDWRFVRSAAGLHGLDGPVDLHVDSWGNLPPAQQAEFLSLVSYLNRKVS